MYVVCVFRLQAVGTALTDSAQQSISGQKQSAKVEPGSVSLSVSVYNYHLILTPRSTASVDLGTPTVCGNVLPTVSLPSLIGCVPFDFSLMHPRRKYCGALQLVDKVSYLQIRWLLALISCRLSDACAISVFSLMLT